MVSLVNRSRSVLSFLWVLFLATPFLFLLLSWLQPQPALWQHLASTVLTDYLLNTLILALAVGAISALIGVLPAWFLSQYQLPWAGFFKLALLLPLAIPTYIMAFTYVGLLDFSGPIQSMLRQLIGENVNHLFPDIQNLFGTAIIMSLVLFPYVFAVALVAFSNQSKSYYEVAKTQGLSEFQYFRKLALPMALPAIIAGMSLAMMEAMADFGAVEYMGVATFTTGVFRTWFGMNNLYAASQLATTLVMFVLLLLWLEQWSRQRQRFYQTNLHISGQHKRTLRKFQRRIVLAGLLLLVFTSFAVPALLLVYWSLLSVSQGVTFDVLQLLRNSFLVAAIAALVIVSTALYLCYQKRFHNTTGNDVNLKVIGSGYAFPGTVIAIGAVMVLSGLDRQINIAFKSAFDWQPGLILSGSIFALVFAYTVRFSTVGIQYVNSGLLRIHHNLDEAAQSLGASKFRLLSRVHWPLLKPTVWITLLVVFVDVVKELPATLILRPFNFDTLAVKTYELAKDERLTDAAFPALCIVMLSLVPVILLARAGNAPKDDFTE